jgi:hypothetical protein
MKIDNKKILKISSFGFVVWLIPTLITLLLSSLNEMFFFDVISAVSIALTVTVLSYIYFKDVGVHCVKEGMIIGLIWLIISIVLDIILILLDVTKLTLVQYSVYVAPLYVIIPAITIGFGLYKDQMREN